MESTATNDWLDLFVYAAFFAATCMTAFLVPLYAMGHHGFEGSSCDSYFDCASCYSFYRARGTLLVSLTFVALIIMINGRSYRDVEWGPKEITETIRSKAITFMLLFDIVCFCVFFYVPTVAIKGVYMMYITWEWGLVIALNILAVIFGEGYKFLE